MLRAIVKIGDGDSGNFRTFEFDCHALEKVLNYSCPTKVIGFEIIRDDSALKAESSERARQVTATDIMQGGRPGGEMRYDSEPELSRDVAVLKAENLQRENVLDDLEFRQQAYAELQRRTEQASVAKTERLTEEQNRFGPLWVLKKLDGEYVRSTSDEGAPAALVFFSEHDAGKAAEYQAKFFDISSTPVRVV